MPPRSRLTKHTSPMAMEDLQFSEWERSRISNQDVNLLKKLGFMKQEKTLIFPGEESYPTPRIGYQVTFVDHLIRGLATLCLWSATPSSHPNSTLHISIFITLCECFLGTPPNWGLWKRIFLVRRNSSHNTAYNVGGVVICVRPDVEYFDVKFPDSVQGWRKRWLYSHEEHNDAQEYNVAPFDGGEKIFRRRSWDAEASDEEKTATEALMKRIHELQNTRGKELSGIQITAYFLRIWVQPLQARKNPLWMYAGKKDVDRLSKDLSMKDLEKLVRKISSLSKKDAVPSSCRVEPYSGTNALPKKHQVLSSLPPLPEGGEVEERTVVTDDNQGTSRPESEVAGSHKSAASSEREVESEASESSRSLPSAASPKNKRKREDVEDSGTSKAGKSPDEETSPEEEGKAFNPYDDALVSSRDEEEDPIVNVIAPTSTSHTLVLSETRPATEEISPPRRDIGNLTPPGSPRAPSPKRARVGEGSNLLTGSSSTPSMDDPLMQEFIHLGTQFVWYRDHANSLKEALTIANKRADDLALELAKSEKAPQQLAREGEIAARLESQNRRFVRKTSQEYELEKPVDDRLLDALSLLEIYGDEVRQSISDARTAFSRLFPYFFPNTDEPSTFAALTKCFIPKEDLGLALRQENLKISVEGTIALVAESNRASTEIDSDFSSSDEELSSPRFINTKAGGKLAKIFSDTSFGSSADSFISSDSDSVDSFNFIDKSAAIGKGVGKTNSFPEQKKGSSFRVKQTKSRTKSTIRKFGR
ncbi:hypothetical protein QYE76_056607 [Lolium multiflorum]|uniref:Transposase (putative) gypsy type domain-containing protein n=1 Tax=Lolium multiflorum TaxID=4521 RepID=A0AAD8T3N8_LOLMU|nr:hypothetical protein QYE76_056607 [Lolium multiflorum]